MEVAIASLLTAGDDGVFGICGAVGTNGILGLIVAEAVGAGGTGSESAAGPFFMGGALPVTLPAEAEADDEDFGIDGIEAVLGGVVFAAEAGVVAPFRAGVGADSGFGESGPVLARGSPWALPLLEESDPGGAFSCVILMMSLVK